MKKEILKTIKFIALVAVLAIGISYLSFKNPEKSSATGCISQGSAGSNICALLDEGAELQVKAGGLTVGAFIARGDSLLSQGGGGSPALPTYISGNLNVSGTDLTSQYGTVKVGSLDGADTRKVCAGYNGQLFICGETPPSNIVPSSSN